MSTQTKRKSNIFSSLRQRTSFKDLHSQLKPSRSFTAEKPLPLKPVDLNNVSCSKKSQMNKAVQEQSIREGPRPEIPLKDSVRAHATKKDFKQAFPSNTVVISENPDLSEVANRRLSTVFKTRESPSSEKTLTSIESQSDLASLDTLFMDNRSLNDTLADIEPLADNIKHLNYTGYIDLDHEKPCTPAKLRRTSNYGNINQFISKDGILPMNNRASLELEAKEIQRYTSKIAKTPNENFSVRLIENAFTMTFFQNDMDTDRKARYWDDLDFSEVLKSDWDSSLDPLVL